MTTWESPLVPGVTFEVMMVTPDIAKGFLDSIEKQRKASNARVERYALDMDSGEWPFTGDPMRFDADGNFIDGQHRALGVVESGQAQPIMIIRGLPANVMQQLDIGFKRTFANLLQIAEIANPSLVASTTRANFHWANGLYGEKSVARVEHAPRFGVEPTHAELWKHYTHHAASIELAAREAARMSFHFANRRVSRTTLALAWLVMGDIDPFRRDAFWGQVLGEVEFTSNKAGYPPRTLADRLGRSLANHETPAPQWVQVATIFYAWNAWVSGKTLEVLRPPHAPEPRFMPQPIDPATWGPSATDQAEEAL